MEDWLYTIPETMARAVENRDELMMLQNYTRIADLNYKMNQYNRIPSLLGVAEYGYQGEKYGFTVNSDYLLASVIFRWNIFSGFQNNAKIQQARIQQDITEKHYAETKSKIELEVIQSWYDLQASRKSIDASKSCRKH